MKFKLIKLVEADSQEEMDGLLSTARDENRLDILGGSDFTCELVDATETVDAE